MTFFEWDEQKATKNLLKHGISFDEAMEAFYDPHLIMEPERIVDGELRWQSIGAIKNRVLILVAHTVGDVEDNEIIRIISARFADRKEKRRYEQDR